MATASRILNSVIQMVSVNTNALIHNPVTNIHGFINYSKLDISLKYN